MSLLKTAFRSEESVAARPPGPAAKMRGGSRAWARYRAAQIFFPILYVARKPPDTPKNRRSASLHFYKIPFQHPIALFRTPQPNNFERFRRSGY
jgi:hypothetical protein